MRSRVKKLLHVQNDEAVDGLTTGFGQTVPSDGERGWVFGARFTSLVTGDSYNNEGTLLACDFNAAAVLTGAQNTLVGATAGTAVASKALIVDSNSDIAAIRNLGATGVATLGAAVIGGGYGDTGATISAAGVGQFDGALTTDGALTAASLVCTAGATFGGGYGATGVTITTAGVVTIAGATTIDGALTVGSIAAIVCTAGATFGGGYGSTGATISTAGVGTFNGALTTDGALTAASLVCTAGATFGGGYASTGVTITTAGVVTIAGATTIDGATGIAGALTAASIVCTAGATFGGGYGSTGATISTAGVGTFNGALTADGILTAGSLVIASVAIGVTMAGTYDNALRITNSLATSAQTTVRVLDTYTKVDGYHTAVMGASILLPSGGTGAGAAIGVYGEANIQGICTGTNYSFGVRGTLQLTDDTVINGASSIFGAINASMKNTGTPTLTTGHVCGIYLENLIDVDMSAKTGISTFAYMANNASATCTMNSAIYLYGPKVTYFAQIYDGTVGGCIATSAGASATKYIVVDVDGTDYKIELLATA